jgi:DNA-binding MarR family transcriptional regulator
MAGEAHSAAADAAVALERAMPMVVRWFTRSEVKRAMRGDAVPNLSWTDAWLLGRISDTGPVRLSELAAWQEVDRSTITTQVRRLEDLGLVDRHADPRDGRAVLVRANRAGMARHRRTKQTARQLYERLLADWSEQDLQAAAQVARRLTETFERPQVIPPQEDAATQ